MLTFERIKKICNDLAALEHRDLFVPTQLQRLDGHYDGSSNDEFRIVNNGEIWSGELYYGYFKFDFTLPESHTDECILLFDLTCNAEVPAAQIKVYVDEVLIQGVDSNHVEVHVKRHDDPQHVYHVGIHYYGNRMNNLHKLGVKVCAIAEDIRALRYDIEVPLLVAMELGETDYDAIKIMNALHEAVNYIDFRQPYSRGFHQSITETRDYMREEFYGKLCTKEGKPLVSCVGSTHIDVAWKWTLAETEDKIDRSFSTVLELMHQYPEYIFLSSQPVLYEYFKMNCPDKYKLLKEKVLQGQWEAEGGMYLEADTNVSSGESLIRQLVYGLQFYKDEFGVDNHILWLPDVFGYCSSLPQILKKSGIDYFMTTKISWNQFNKIPHDTFMWQGIDGTEILTHFIATQDYHSGDDFRTTYNGFFTPSHIMGTWERYGDKNLNDNVLSAFGFGDGGGGPTWEMLETQKRMAHGIPGAPVTQIETVNSFFERLDRDVSGSKHLKKWVGELYLEYHRGTYTSMARNKKYNRQCEKMLMDVELLACLAKNHCFKSDLDTCWKLVLLNQFHDILPGSSIKEVYDESKEQYEQVLETLEQIKDVCIDRIKEDIHTEDKSLMVLNTLSFQRDDIVEFELEDNAVAGLADSDEVYTVQQVEGNKGIAYIKVMPSKGYKTLAMVGEGSTIGNPLTVTETCLENKFFKIGVNDRGEFISFCDKQNDRELTSDQPMNQIVAYQDKPTRHNNWNIDPYYLEKSFEIEDVESVEVIEEGPVRGILRVTKRFNQSIIVQDICIYADVDRVDMKTTIDYHENEVMLKVHFPVDVLSPVASYDIQFGSVERPTHMNTSWDRAKYEVCAHKWMDLSDHGYGVSILNDCRYGCDVHGNTMSLTLVKSGMFPNPKADREVHEFTYSIYPHKGAYRQADTVKQSYYLNYKPYTTVLMTQQGSDDGCYAFATSNKDNVIIETVKFAEDGNGIIIRAYEAIGATTDATLSFAQCVEHIDDCMMTEEVLGEIAVDADSCTLRFKPYEIKTLRLSGKQIG